MEPSAVGKMPIARTVLVAVDSADESRAALNFLFTGDRHGGDKLSGTPSDQVILYHCQGAASTAPGSDRDSSVNSLKKELLEQCSSRHAKCRFQTDVSSQIAHSIVARADEVHADLIVMGTNRTSHCSDAAAHPILDHVMKYSSQAVMVVPK